MKEFVQFGTKLPWFIKIVRLQKVVTSKLIVFNLVFNFLSFVQKSTVIRKKTNTSFIILKLVSFIITNISFIKLYSSVLLVCFIIKLVLVNLLGQTSISYFF